MTVLEEALEHIVKAIVEGHGGSIRVESVPGDTTFIVDLPVSRASSATVPSAADSAEPAETSQ